MYAYCMQFYFPELSALRNKTHAGIAAALKTRRHMRQVNFGGSWKYHRKQHEITDDLIENCHTLCDYFIQAPDKEYKLTISMDTGYIYTNNLQIITDLINLPGVKFEQLKEVSLDIPVDSIKIRSAKHDLRTYFKTQWLSSEEQKVNLQQMLYSQKDIRLSPSLSEWFERYTASKYIADNFFIDHNSMNIITMLSLVCPIKIKHTLHIIRDK